MGKFNKRQGDGERCWKCEICLELIPIEHYFNKGDEITCYECGTEYIIISKAPLKLTMLETSYDPDDYVEEMFF